MTARSARAFTLLETLAVILVLSIALPPMLGTIIDAAKSRRNAALAARASFLASGVLEHILADANSADASLGFNALANSSTYLDTATTGLRARVQPMADQAALFGIQYSVTIGALTNYAGVATGDAAADVYRVVTVTATFPSSRSGTASISVSALATNL